MISVNEALAYIAQHQRDFGTEKVPLRTAARRVLASEIKADRDFPPFHRVTMDGIAVNSNAFRAGHSTFKIEKMQPAGQPQQTLDDPGNCIEVMTGAVLPAGTDAVIPYEECMIADGMAAVSVGDIQSFQNVHRQGADGLQGDVLVPVNTLITPATIDILASVGISSVVVRRQPHIAVIATGDELVDVAETPLPHQIRRSNSYMLEAALSAEGVTAELHYLPDDYAVMRSQLTAIQGQYDVLLFSGAVSKGKYDFLPQVLAALGMQPVFHRVAQKPGKPFLFGVFKDGPLVFGFPGNPVSTLVCYKIFFLPWLHQCILREARMLTAQLSVDVQFRPALTYHLLVSLRMDDGILLATPCAGANSGDMVSLQRADAIVTLPAEVTEFKAGVAYPLRLLAPFF